MGSPADVWTLRPQPLIGGGSGPEPGPSERPPRSGSDRSVSSDTSGSPLLSLITLIGGSLSRKWRPGTLLI